MSEKIDFVPDEVHTARVIRKRVGQCLVGALGLLGAVTLASFALGLQNSRVEAKLSPLRERVEATRSWQDRVEPLATKLEETIDRQRAMSHLMKGPRWAPVLGDLSDAMHDSLRLTQCTLSLEQDSNSEEEGATLILMRISGVAVSDVDLVEFTSRLSRSLHLSELRLDMSRRLTDSETFGMVEFEMAGAVR